MIIELEQEVNSGKTRRHIIAASVFLAVFGLYLWCFQPDGGWGDGADFVLTSYFLGVPHPTGYPLTALLGKLAATVPAGAAAFRVGLLSSYSGALAVAVFFFPSR